jgi:hypothetical protein
MIMPSDFHPRSVAISAYGTSLLYGLSAGAIAPMIAPMIALNAILRDPPRSSAILRGTSPAVAGLVVSR